MGIFMHRLEKNMRFATFIILSGYAYVFNPCQTISKETCSLHFNEICGSDGKTYLNECVFYKAACSLKISLTIKRRGACCPTEAKCTNSESEETVDGARYHKNDCFFWMDKCQFLSYTEQWISKNGDVLVGADTTETGRKKREEIDEFFKNYGISELNTENLTWSELNTALHGVYYLP